MNKGWFVFVWVIVLSGCVGKKDSGEKEKGELLISTEIKYADGFKVFVLGTSKLVQVVYPFQGATSGYTYLFVPRGEKPPGHHPATKVIFTPVESIVCTSTTHIPLLDYLGETDKLVGFPTTDYISSGKMRKRIDEGKVTELGVDKGLNLERLAVLKPGAVMGYTMSSDYGQFKKMEELGIPVVINAEYLEQHPLGRAEWIKFMGLLFNKERQADSVFTIIEKNYQQARAILANNPDRPTVLSGIVYGDAWFLPAGQNYQAKLFDDAGCRYLWDESPGTGYLEISFESVYEKANAAELWIGTGTYKNLEEMRAADLRYARFIAFQNKQVYNYDARKGARGGNEFLELGYLRPDLVLMDLIKIAHPGLLPEHELFFHRKLP
ncbi:MAG TPA: ABC transporter substrate-binding protein [Chryseosolibacter sp.]|nr:ABC transporter substrate-binding protein [Chryseosolibacter sp.]